MPFVPLSLLAFAIAALAATAAAATEAVFECTDSETVTATFSAPDVQSGSVTLRFAEAEEEVVLPQVLSADGGRYADDRTEFWTKGKGATLTRDGKSETCQTE